MNIKVFQCNPIAENAWLLWDDGGHGVVVDPGFDGEEELSLFRKYVSDNRITLDAVWLTHAHPDHILGVAAIQHEYGVPVRMGEKEDDILRLAPVMGRAIGLPVADNSFRTEHVRGGDLLHCGEAVFQVIDTPGHTPGGVSYYDEADAVLLTGDTLFEGSIGRTDLPGGEYDQLIVSIMDHLMGLPGEVDILPGHGRSSSIARERTTNPFLEPWGDEEDMEKAGLL